MAGHRRGGRGALGCPRSGRPRQLPALCASHHPRAVRRFDQSGRSDGVGGSASAALGYVDVTKGPFRADPTGKKDSTQAIQAAVLFARDHQMACFFPAGTYLLSDTLSCTQQLYKRANGRVFGGNRFPNVLVGSRGGAAAAARPRAAGGRFCRPGQTQNLCPLLVADIEIPRRRTA